MLHTGRTPASAHNHASSSRVKAPAAVAKAPCGPRQRSGPARLVKSRALGDLVSPESVDVTTAAYVGLGLAGLSFVGTFGVAPRFKDSFKEEIDWKDMYPELVKSGMKSVPPSEAYAKRKSAAIVDVRLPAKYQACHAVGSTSLPAYIPIQKWDIPSIIRRLGFAFFGIYGTELNTNFAEEAAEAVPKGKQIYLICENGGSLQNKPGTMFGFQSRSLKAAYYLQRAGYQKVAYVQGGLAQWIRDGLPTSEASAETTDDDDEGSDDEGGSRMGTGFSSKSLRELVGTFGSSRR